jgi:hypothetical protein
MYITSVSGNLQLGHINYNSSFTHKAKSYVDRKIQYNIYLLYIWYCRCDSPRRWDYEYRRVECCVPIVAVTVILNARGPCTQEVEVWWQSSVELRQRLAGWLATLQINWYLYTSLAGSWKGDAWFMIHIITSAEYTPAFLDVCRHCCWLTKSFSHLEITRDSGLSGIVKSIYCRHIDLWIIPPMPDRPKVMIQTKTDTLLLLAAR